MLTVGFGALGVGEVGGALILIAWFALLWFYGGQFETFWNGQTPGKYLMRLRVLTVNGEPVAGWQAVLRNILREADLLPVVALGDLAFRVPTFMAGRSPRCRTAATSGWAIWWPARWWWSSSATC